MNLEATVRLVNGVAIVDLSGRILLGPDAECLRNTLLDVYEQGHRRILVNMAGVTFTDSAGLGDLVGTYTMIKQRGGNIKLVNLQKKVMQMMHSTRLDSLMEIYDDEQAAIESL